MIENGRTEEAIDHCFHMLRFYPRLVETYILLGTAFLVEQRYQEADDIFLRALSVRPDDLVAHIGVSVIREHQNRLDDAIWHMRTAYEIQPSNRVLQDELCRLYGVRDGIKPTKVHLTRGALARMYYRGKLYPQAVAELQVSTKDDENRLDLQLLLAQTYLIMGQINDAIKTSLLILDRLPNCLEANRILVKTLSKERQQQLYNTSYERVVSIDPYYAFVTAGMSTSDQVPDDAVMIERLEEYPQNHMDVTSTSDDITRPVQAAVVAGNSLQETLPDWILDLDEESASSDDIDVAQNSQTQKISAKAEIPEIGKAPLSAEDTKPIHLTAPPDTKATTQENDKVNVPSKKEIDQEKSPSQTSDQLPGKPE